MYKKILIFAIIICLIFAFITCSDDPPTAPSSNNNIYADTSDHMYALIQNSYGGAGWDWGTGIISTNDNGFIITGSTDSYGSGKNTLYIVKTDSTGAEVWDTIYGGTGEDNAEAIVAGPNNTFTIGGVSSSFAGGYNFYLLNINEDGTSNWEKTYGTDSTEWGTDLIALNDGYAMCGYQIPTDLSDGGNFYFVRTDLNGNLLWDKTFHRSDNEWAFSLTATSDGGFAIAGQKNYDGNSNVDGFIIKTDDTGKVLWEETYGGASDEHLYSIIESNDGSLIANGSTRSMGTTNEELLYLLKTNSSGVMQWEKSYGTTGNILGREVIENQDGTLIFTGLTNTNSDGTGIVKTDADGNLLWNESIGLTGTGMSIVSNETGKYIVTGFAVNNTSASPDVLFISIEER